MEVKVDAFNCDHDISETCEKCDGFSPETLEMMENEGASLSVQAEIIQGDVKEVKFTREGGIILDGVKLDRLVHGMQYDARGGDHRRLIHFDCYVTDDEGAVIIKDNDIVTEKLTYQWAFE
jgi:hypothetical protein